MQVSIPSPKWEGQIAHFCTMETAFPRCWIFNTQKIFEQTLSIVPTSQKIEYKLFKHLKNKICVYNRDEKDTSKAFKRSGLGKLWDCLAEQKVVPTRHNFSNGQRHLSIFILKVKVIEPLRTCSICISTPPGGRAFKQLSCGYIRALLQGKKRHTCFEAAAVIYDRQLYKFWNVI